MITTTINKKYLDEVTKRLRLLGVDETLIAETKETGKIPVMHNAVTDFELTNVHLKALELFHQQIYSKEFTPFYIVESSFNDCSLVLVLIIDHDSEEWDIDRAAIKYRGIHNAFVYNIDDPSISEYKIISMSI